MHAFSLYCRDLSEHWDVVVSLKSAEAVLPSIGETDSSFEQ